MVWYSTAQPQHKYLRLIHEANINAIWPFALFASVALIGLRGASVLLCSIITATILILTIPVRCSLFSHRAWGYCDQR